MHGLTVLPGDDQVAELLHAALAEVTHGIAAAPDVGKATGDVHRAAQGSGDLGNGDIPGSQLVGVEGDMNLGLALARQLHPGHAGNPGQPGLHLAVDQLLVVCHVLGVVARQRVDQQRRGHTEPPATAGDDLWLIGVGG